MKIAYVTMAFPVKSETFAATDIKQLLNYGHEVEVYCLRRKLKNNSYLLSERGVPSLKVINPTLTSLFSAICFLILNPYLLFKIYSSVREGEGRGVRFFFKNLYAIISSLFLVKKIKFFSPDVVHLFWGHYPCVAGFILKELMPDVKVSIFLGAHDLTVGYKPSIAFSKLSHRVFTHVSANVPVLIGLGVPEKKIRVVYRGVDGNINRSLECRTLNTPFLICTAARLIKDKRVDLVIELVSNLNMLGVKSELHIFGDGPEEDNLRTLVSNLKLKSQVFFRGHTAQSELFEFMNKAHFFILFTEYGSDRLPNVLKEAMYRRCLVFTSFSLGIEELVVHEVTGFVIKDNYVNTATRILSGMSNEDYIQICESAANKIDKDFIVSSSMKKYLIEWAN